MLDQVEIFHGLSSDELAALEHSSTSETYSKNTVVIQENEPASFFEVMVTLMSLGNLRAAFSSCPLSYILGCSLQTGY